MTPVTAFSDPWQDWLDEVRRRREEAYALRQQNKKQAREAHARARTYGLSRRHARKIQQVRRRDQ